MLPFEDDYNLDSYCFNALDFTVSPSIRTARGALRHLRNLFNNLSVRIFGAQARIGFYCEFVDSLLLDLRFLGTNRSVPPHLIAAEQEKFQIIVAATAREIDRIAGIVNHLEELLIFVRDKCTALSFFVTTVK